VVSNNEGVWAPDLIYLNGQYYLYYAIANAQNACAIGLVTSPTLNPKSADYKWTDRGLVVSNSGSATYCAIDPAPVLDTSGDLWLSWGSGYTHPSTANTIYVTRLDNMTGLPISNQPTPGYPLEQGHIEASYLYYHEGSYYLFWNSGGCCSGASSTYEIHVARSPTITGPYTGAKIFYSSTGGIHGPGQIGVYDQCGASRFTYHYYPDAGGSVLGENELSWGSDGWPVVGAISNTPLTPCAGGAPDAGGAGGASGTSSASSASGAGGTATGGSAGEGASGSTTAGSGGAAAVAGSSSAASGSGGKSGDGVGGGETGGAGAGGRSVASGCSCEIEGSSNDAGMALLFGVAIEVARRRGKRNGRR
jgi:hypothetical protein